MSSIFTQDLILLISKRNLKEIQKVKERKFSSSWKDVILVGWDMRWFPEALKGLQITTEKFEK